MTKKKETEVAVIDLDLIEVNKLPELVNFKERGQKLVKECKFVEISDNSTYETAKKNRTALRTFRTDVEKSDKAIKSKLNNFKNRVGEVSASLIAITEPAEKTQQEEVDRYEQIKEKERLEKLRLEQERVDNIKKKIGEFRQNWENLISVLKFEGIENCKQNFENSISDYDRESLQEYGVLFDDSIAYLHNLLESRIKTLTEQEEIRITQIELAKEKERQRIEAERIAEEQRKEREKLEAEQKAEAEKIRLAKEEFEKEKKEFEAEQWKQVVLNRKNHLTSLGFAEDKNGNYVFKSFMFLLDNIISLKADAYSILLEDAMNYISDSSNSVFEEVKSEQSDKEEYHEADVDPKGLSTRLKANTPAFELLSPEREELTWDDIFYDYFDIEMPREFLEFLKKNYNCPTRKI